MMLEPEDLTYGQYSSQNHIFTDVFRSLYSDEPGYTYGHQNPIYESRIDFIIVNDYLSDYLINSTVGDTETAETGSDHYCVDFFLDVFALQNQTDITAPAKVLGVNADAISTTEINLSWNPNSESDFDHYNIYRDGTKIAQTTISSYSDIGLTANTEFVYEISAVDTVGNEGMKSDSVIIKTQDETNIPELPLSSGGLIIFLAVESALVLIIFIRLKYFRKPKRK